MPDVALDAGNSKRGLALDTAKCLGDGVALYGVSDRCSGCMCLDVVELARCTAGTGRSLVNQLDLGMARWCTDIPARGETRCAICRPGGVHRSRLDHGEDRVSVPFGRRQWFQCKDKRSFGTHVAIGFRIERVAGTVRADDSHEIEAAAHPGAAQICDSTNERLFAISACERVHRRVQGSQAGGASRAIRRRRPHEVEVVGNPIGQHGEADA